ncbi:MAG: 1,4-dihydroxy-2-naphthoate octaprenyltransferase [Chloroflexota bacterium]|nr:1,4-dihydroxy-2-naphthoate octaprenyltransferase [Chloroflexota bacterium]
MEKDLENVDSVASEDRKTASYADGTRLRANKATEPAGDSTQKMPDRMYVNGSIPEAGAARSNMLASTHIVTADSVQAEEVPTIPLDSLQTINSLQPEVSVRSVASSRSVHIPTPLVVQPSEYRRGMGEWLQLWWEGIRPLYFPLIVVPALLGSVLAWTQTIAPGRPLGHFHLLPFIGTIVSLLLLQTGANLINDYYDYLRGIDTSNALGPGGLIQQGLIRPARLLSSGLTVLGLGALLGLIVASAGGPLVYFFGLVGLLCAYFYSAPPRALAALGLGELIAFLIFGPLITLGAYLVQGGHLAYSAFVYSLPLGLLAAATIHANNMRDTEGDMHAGKHTIASLIGIQRSRIWYLVLLLAAYVLIIFFGMPRGAPHWILITLWTFPLLVVIISGAVRTDISTGFDLVMRQTLRLETFFGILLLVALGVQAMIPVLPHLPAHILPI